MIYYQQPHRVRGMGFSFSDVLNTLEKPILVPIERTLSISSRVAGDVLGAVGGVLPQAAGIVGGTLHSLAAGAMPPPPPKKVSNLPIIIGAGAGALVLFLLLRNRGSAPPA